MQSLYSILARPLPRGKRAFDIVGAATGLIFLSPILAAVAVAIKTTSRGPVFFVQERTGLNMRRFRMYKFRTMVNRAADRIEEVKHLNQMTGPLIKIDKDPRLTLIGFFLRKTSLDELPQLLNVLKGDMTFIGPRALSPLPSQYEPWQLRRFTVTPGIACVWQAGRRAERNFAEWMRSDIRYISNSSCLNDLRILSKTILEVIRCHGAM